MFNKINQRTTLDTVLTMLRKAIFDGRLQPGSQLRESQISESMGISRAPLREALGKLEEEGLIVKVPFKGAFVAEISRDAVEEISIVRQLVEAHVIEKALPMLLADELSHMEGLVEDLKNAALVNDFQGALKAHLELHRLFYECSRNEVLMSMWKSWESQLRLFFVEDLQNLFDPGVSARVHTKLVALIKTGDIDKIRQAVTDHVHGNTLPLVKNPQ